MKEYTHRLGKGIIQFKASTIEDLLINMADSGIMFSNIDKIEELINEVSYRADSNISAVKYIFINEGSTVLTLIEDKEMGNFVIERTSEETILNRIYDSVYGA